MTSRGSTSSVALKKAVDSLGAFCTAGSHNGRFRADLGTCAQSLSLTKEITVFNDVVNAYSLKEWFRIVITGEQGFVGSFLVEL